MLTLDQLNALSQGYLPGLLGVELTEVGDKRLTAQLTIRHELLAPNGYLHAGTVISLADTVCGYGVLANFLGTALEGLLCCEATLLHAGRTTQVWDARVTNADDMVIALFRCTQLLIYQRP